MKRSNKEPIKCNETKVTFERKDFYNIWSQLGSIQVLYKNIFLESWTPPLTTPKNTHIYMMNFKLKQCVCVVGSKKHKFSETFFISTLGSIVTKRKNVLKISLNVYIILEHTFIYLCCIILLVFIV